MSEIFLGVNIDHVATLRNARGTSYPDPVLAAGICELAGAEGIVVHLREDRRHIRAVIFKRAFKLFEGSDDVVDDHVTDREPNRRVRGVNLVHVRRGRTRHQESHRRQHHQFRLHDSIPPLHTVFLKRYRNGVRSQTPRGSYRVAKAEERQVISY